MQQRNSERIELVEDTIDEFDEEDSGENDSGELKKLSSCSVQIVNRTCYHVAFKLTTDNPNKYFVSPNTGVIDPNSACNFSVTMQAQKVAPLDMVFRDTLLVQSTVVQAGMKEGDLTSNMLFSKEDGKVVEEKRLKVILIPSTSQLVQSNEDKVLKGDLLQKHNFHAKMLTGPRWKGKGSEVKALANPISKSISDLQSSLIKSNSRAILSGCSVLLASNPEQTDLLSQTCFGQPIITVDKDKQWFQLTFEEAFYLCFYLKCKKIAGGDDVIKTDNKLWEYMTSRRVSFPDFFKAYSHLRVKNWVVRSGCQYGVDFVA
ncbi:hypothetical protein L1987_51509 [Smallanthus sonchifolius]|uniref:Uncharacterized protein n=1 Tax=Smallanthus sonchifolius TaxID=185202 RepID=A0ACB9EQV3_9ASTR|nr:hypothetical protein L1987_51509 [Smallanthus sonchifolius]